MSKRNKQYQPTNKYFIAEPSYWPLLGSVGLFISVFGFVQLLHGNAFGMGLLLVGLGVLLLTLFGWFGMVIRESLAGLHSVQMDRTYRWGMFWFIVSEIFLFAIFFIALFYTRVFGITELGGDATAFAKTWLLTKGQMTHQILWPDFSANWPLLKNPNPQLFPGPLGVIDPWQIPALNTLLLLTSAVTLTWAHWSLQLKRQRSLLTGLCLTILLGLLFEALQVYEYVHAYSALNLTLRSGIYGTTFYALTGLHAMHVNVGIVMLFVILVRCLKGHFLPEHHFAFEAVAWYWHFVDVVWLFLFVFVYWL
jgi:cytochrome c oxidase subunit 3